MEKPYGQAVYPQYYSIKRRCDTFTASEFSLCFVNSLSKAGFFLAADKKTKCFVSGCCIVNWDETDNPIQAHACFFPNCRYAKLLGESPDRLLEMEDCLAVQVLLQMGHELSSVEAAYRQVTESDHEEPTSQKLLDKIFETGRWKILESRETVERPPLKWETAEEVPEVDISQHKKYAEECQALRQRLKELEDMQTCLHCHEKPRALVNLPCGHITTCNDCAYKACKCIQCKKLIQGIVRVYLV